MEKESINFYRKKRWHLIAIKNLIGTLLRYELQVNGGTHSEKTIKKVKQTASVMLVVAVLAASLPETGMYVHAVEQESATEPSSIDGEIKLKQGAKNPVVEKVELVSNTDAFQYENNKISFKEKLMIGFLA